MVKRREKMKKDDLQLNIEVYDKRYQAKDFSGQLLAEYTAATTKTRYIIAHYPIISQDINEICYFRPAFAPLYSNQYYHHHSSSNLVTQNNQWNSSQNYASLHLNHHHHLQNKRDFDGMSTSSSRKEKRQYKKRKHKTQREIIKPGRIQSTISKYAQEKFLTFNDGILVETYDGLFSSDDEDLSTQLGASESEDEGIYPFRRNRNCNYYKVRSIIISTFYR